MSPRRDSTALPAAASIAACRSGIEITPRASSAFRRRSTSPSAMGATRPRGSLLRLVVTEEGTSPVIGSTLELIPRIKLVGEPLFGPLEDRLEIDGVFPNESDREVFAGQRHLDLDAGLCIDDLGKEIVP